MFITLPRFGTLLEALTKAGVETKSARGWWGGVTRDDDIVVTAWIDAVAGGGRFTIFRPTTRHGGLRDMWEVGRIEPGAPVKLIIVRQRGNVPFGQEGRQVHSAGLMPGQWRICKVNGDSAIVEPVKSSD